MTARIISAGSGPRRALVLLFFVPPIRRPGDPHMDDQIRAALPGACVIAYSDADGESIAAAEARARKVGWTGGPLAIGGFSAGCLRGVRARLREGAKPDAVIAIDGTHADLPPAAWQLDVWRPIVADARAGRRLFVATATQQTYVERLPGEARYMATITLLRRLTGWPLASPGPLPLGEHASEGDCHVHSYASKSMDGNAHSDQQTRALPEMLRLHLAPWLARQAGGSPAPAEDRATPAPPTPEATTLRVPRVLRRGAKGDDVGELQRRLIAVGYDPGSADESFGPLTEAAVRELQRDARVTSDGVVGPATRAALENAAPRTLPPAPSAPPASIPAPASHPALWIPAKNFTRAGRARVDVVVIHTTESPRRPGAARAVAQWFGGASAPQASSHYVIDDDETFRCVEEQNVAWAAPGANSVGVQIEVCGYAKQTEEEWLTGRILPRLAGLVADICQRHGIPVAKLSPADLVAGKRGVTGHVDASKAFKKSDHWDPGPGFPWDRFLEMVRTKMAAG